MKVLNYLHPTGFATRPDILAIKKKYIHRVADPNFLTLDFMHALIESVPSICYELWTGSLSSLFSPC